MVDNPYNDARKGAHVVCRWGGVIKWRELASPSPGRILKARRLFHLVAKILYMVTKCPIMSHPRIYSGQQEGFS
jgi:hypothetical protein